MDNYRLRAARKHEQKTVSGSMLKVLWQTAWTRWCVGNTHKYIFLYVSAYLAFFSYTFKAEFGRTGVRVYLGRK